MLSTISLIGLINFLEKNFLIFLLFDTKNDTLLSSVKIILNKYLEYIIN